MGEIDRLCAKLNWAPTRVAALKMCLEQAFFAPVVNTAFVVLQSLLSGQSPSEIVPHVRKSFFSVWKGNILVWGPTGFLSYRFVPLRYRVLFGNFVGVLWTIWLLL